VTIEIDISIVGADVRNFNAVGGRILLSSLPLYINKGFLGGAKSNKLYPRDILLTRGGGRGQKNALRRESNENW